MYILNNVDPITVHPVLSRFFLSRKSSFAVAIFSAKEYSFAEKPRNNILSRKKTAKEYSFAEKTAKQYT